MSTANPAATELETMMVRLDGDNSGLDRMTRDAERDITTFGQRMEAIAFSAEKKFAKVGKNLTRYLTLPLAGVGAAGVKAFADFDDAMTQSTAIMGNVSKKVRAEMEATALEIAGRTTTAPVDLAKAYYFLASAGLNATESMQLLGTMQEFATAGAFDMATATDLLTDALTALGMKTSQMQELSDALVLAGVQSNASVQQFSEALTNDAAGTMKEFGQELSTTMAVLDAYASKGKKGAEAGSLLGRAARLLTQAYRDNGEVFQKYGIEVVDQATGEYRDMINIIVDMENAFRDLTGPQRDAALEQLGFAALAQKSITPLIGMSDAMKRWKKEQESATGYTKDVAGKQLKSFTSEMKLLYNQATIAAIEIGKILVPMLTSLGKTVKSVIDWWKSLSDTTKEWLVYAGLAAAALGPIALGASLVIKTYGVLKTVTIALKLHTIALTAAKWANVAASHAMQFASLGTVAAVAAVAYGVYKATRALADYVLGSSDYEATLERSKKLNEELFSLQTQKDVKLLQEINSVRNLKDRRKALNDQLELEQKNLLGLNAQMLKQQELRRTDYQRLEAIHRQQDAC